MIRRTRRKRNTGVRTRIDPKIIIIIGVLLAAIGVLLFILLYGGKEEITERGAMTFRMNGVEAVLIRDEEVLYSAEYARLDYLREEGSDVINGESLATVYKLGYSEEIMQSLMAAREEVYEAQLERIGSTKDQRLEEMNENIDSLKARIARCLMLGEDDDLSTVYWLLDNALKERMDYLRSKVQETETLRALYKTADDKAALLSAWTETVAAPKKGTVSYYFDGYENAMNADKLSMLSPDLINRALKDKGATAWTTGDRTRVCRIVNSERWYAAFVTKGSDLKRTANGLVYEVEISGYGKYRAVALEPIVNGKEVINILEFSENIGELIDLRTVKIDITSDVSGIKIKSDAVRKDKGLTYIELLLSESHYIMRVDVLAEENGMVIIRPHDPTDVLNEGVRYWNRKK